MQRNRLLITWVLSVLLMPLASAAQPPAHVHRIGVLAAFDWPPFEAFRHGLRDLGYVEGHTIVIEYRWTAGQNDRFPALAAELVARPVEVLVTWGTPAARAAKHATSTIPIVMAAISDALETGMVASLAQPGGNITGFAAHNPELEGKRLELLKEAVPTLTRVAVLSNEDPTRPMMWHHTQRAAQALGLHLQRVGVPGYVDFAAAFATMTRAGAEALFVAPNTVFVVHRARIAALAAQHRLPAMYLHREHVEAGGLMAYSPNYHDLFRRAATYVDKILKGARPADLPVERAHKFQLVINLTTAKALGLTIPPSLLFQADEVIQ